MPKIWSVTAGPALDWFTVIVALTGAPPVIVRLIAAVALNVPEVPVIVTGYVPATVVEATAKVTKVELVDEVGLKVAVTPVGWPDAANVTLPANGLMSVTVMVSVPLAPVAIDKLTAEGVSTKPPAAVIVIVMVYVSVVVPEVAVMVIEYVPGGVEQPALSVSVLLPLVIVPNTAVTPEGKPDAERATAPVNPPVSVTGLGNFPEPHCGTDMGGKGPTVKPDVVTVSVMEVVAVNVPEVPVMVIG
jgi:hypothetical protein